MRKRKVTYGVYNIIEWHASLKLGKATVKVPFTGGAITTAGVTPATFTTNDPIVQYAIEHSMDYKRGKIKTVRTYPLDGEVHVERNIKKPATMVYEKVDGCGVMTGEILKDSSIAQIAGSNQSQDVTAEEDEASREDEDFLEDEDLLEEIAESPEVSEISEVSDSGDQEEATTNEKTQVEVHCNDDAKDYLVEKFGVKRSELLNRAMIQSTASQYDIEFVFV